MQKSKFRVWPAILTVVILYALYHRMDDDRFWQVFKQADYGIFCLVVWVSVLILILAGFRWQLMTSRHCHLGLMVSTKLVACSSVFNMIVPSKLGSTAKGYYMAKHKMIDKKLVISMLIYERMSDLFGMCGFFLLSSLFFFSPNPISLCLLFFSLVFMLCFFLFHRTRPLKKEPGDMADNKGLVGKLRFALAVIQLFHQGNGLKKHDILKVNLITLCLWGLYSVQLALFFAMLNFQVPLNVIMTQMYTGLFVGLLPVTIAGIGTRDAAILYLFNGYLEPHQALSIGILTTFRILIPAVMGLPFIAMMFDGPPSSSNRV